MYGMRQYAMEVAAPHRVCSVLRYPVIMMNAGMVKMEQKL